MDIKELVSQYGGFPAIPNDTLYHGLNDSRADLINLAKLGTGKIVQSPLGQEVRRRTKSDLFWTARYFTWETNPEGVGRPIEDNKITEEEYRVICDFFVHKDDSKPLNQQDAIKTRVLLWPRGGFKSTIDVVDASQWILNFPTIRILFQTAADDLAVGFVKETRGHFIIREEEPTLMNLFFPEFCVPENKRENEFQFTCPVWAIKQTKRKEPTVFAASVGSTKSGWHFELMKNDDAVSDRNSESSEQCASVSKKLSLSRKLLKLGGYYIDYIGTRYDDEDHYGVLLEKNVGDIRTTKDRCWELTENATTATKILVGRGIVIKPETVVRLQKEGRPINYKEAAEAGCDLLIPHVMPYSWLMKEWAEQEDVFEGQINQNPRPMSSTVFKREDLIAATVQPQQMPFSGPISQTWDFAYSVKKGRDFSTGSSALWNDKSQMFVHDLVRKRMTPDELAQAVVDFAKQWHPFAVGIENSNGADFLEPMIIDKARRTNDEQVISVCSKIDWFRPDTQADAKRMRMGTMHPRMVGNQLKFASYLPYLEILYTEFIGCMTSRSGRNDIPDVISQQLRYAPRIAAMIEKKEMITWSREDAWYNQMFEDGDEFGRPGWAVPSPLVVPVAESEVSIQPSAPGLDNMLGAGLIG